MCLNIIPTLTSKRHEILSRIFLQYIKSFVKLNNSHKLLRRHPYVFTENSLKLFFT